MSDSEWFIIKDLNEFIDKTRTIVYSNFGEWSDKNDLETLDISLQETDQQELDKILSFEESLLIIKQSLTKQKHKSTKKIRYCLSNDQFYEIIEKLNTRMMSNIINGLVQKGLVESAFDTETNDFIFWLKDTDENPEKPSSI